MKYKKMTLGQRIKIRRLELNLTQKQLAKQLKISVRTLQRWEKGENVNLKSKKIIDLSLTLKLSSDTLLSTSGRFDLNTETASKVIKIFEHYRRKKHEYKPLDFWRVLKYVLVSQMKEKATLQAEVGEYE